MNYIGFNGNCCQAMHFYQFCFGGELELHMVHEMPEFSNHAITSQLVLLATLRCNGFTLLGTDLPSGAVQNASLFLQCDDKMQFFHLLKELSSKGKVLAPATINHYGAMVVSVQDRYGSQWTLYSQNE